LIQSASQILIILRGYMTFILGNTFF
jgi:hypothetical protein